MAVFCLFYTANVKYHLRYFKWSSEDIHIPVSKKHIFDTYMDFSVNHYFTTLSERVHRTKLFPSPLNAVVPGIDP